MQVTVGMQGLHFVNWTKWVSQRYFAGSSFVMREGMNVCLAHAAKQLHD